MGRLYLLKEKKDSCSLKEFIIYRGRKKRNYRKNGAIWILGSVKMVEEERGILRDIGAL